MAMEHTDDMAEDFQHLLNDMFAQVDSDAFDRHTEGAKTYGALKFLSADTLQEAYEEILDLINYARYTAVKVKMLQAVLSEEATALKGSETTGAGAFIPTSEFMKGFQKP